MLSTTKALRQAAQVAERQPLIRFPGRRNVPSNVDHSPHPHPASPTGSLPKGFVQAHAAGSKHATFSSYRDHAQQFGPLQNTIRAEDNAAARTVGNTAGSDLGPVQPPQGQFFDRSELPPRFYRKVPLELAEIEAVESGGAALFN